VIVVTGGGNGIGRELVLSLLRRGSRVTALDLPVIERLCHVNFFGTLYMIKAFLSHLLKRPAAHIVNVASMGGFIPIPGQSIYGATKAAVKLLTEGLNSGQEEKFNPMDPGKAADIIIDEMEKGKERIFVGKDSRMLNRLYRLIPGFASRLIAKNMKSLLPS
jgi:short-subunit dehydrogenase